MNNIFWSCILFGVFIMTECSLENFLFLLQNIEMCAIIRFILVQIIKIQLKTSLSEKKKKCTLMLAIDIRLQ